MATLILMVIVRGMAMLFTGGRYSLSGGINHPGPHHHLVCAGSSGPIHLDLPSAVVVVVLNLSSIPVKGSFFHAISTVGLHFEGGAKFGKESA
jgi:ribose/xylose/arabinose/galactoside ABC-type transport system permease subunit